MKKNWILILVFLMISCSGNDHSKIVPDFFQTLMNTYFPGYTYQYIDANARGNQEYGDLYATFKIKKDDLNQDEMRGIFKKMEKDGWRIVETNNNNYFNYCYGEKFSMIFLYPLKKIEMTPSNVPLNYADFDFWVISAYLGTTKITACNLNKSDFIDFTKLDLLR